MPIFPSRHPATAHSLLCTQVLQRLQQSQEQQSMLLSPHAAGFGFDGEVCELCPIGRLQGPNNVCNIPFSFCLCCYSRRCRIAK